ASEAGTGHDQRRGFAAKSRQCRAASVAWPRRHISLTFVTDITSDTHRHLVWTLLNMEPASPTPSWRDRMLDRLAADAEDHPNHDPAAETTLPLGVRHDRARAFTRLRERLPDGLGRSLGVYGGIAGIATALCIGMMAAGSWYVLSPTTLRIALPPGSEARSEEHTSELQS